MLVAVNELRAKMPCVLLVLSQARQAARAAPMVQIRSAASIHTVSSRTIDLAMSTRSQKGIHQVSSLRL